MCAASTVNDMCVAERKRLLRLKAVARAVCSPHGTNDHMFTTKATLQVGEYWLCFDIERDGLRQVDLTKTHNRWLNISRYVVGTYQSGVQLHKITPGLDDYDNDKWRTSNKTKWTTKFPYFHNTTKRKLYFNMSDGNFNLCFQPLFILYTLEKIGIFNKIFHLYKISSKINKNNFSFIIINT